MVHAKKARQLHTHINLVNFFPKKKKKKKKHINFGCQHIVASTCYLPTDLIVAIYLAAFLDACNISMVTALLFLCLFGLGLDWLSVGGGGAVVLDWSWIALPIAGLFA